MGRFVDPNKIILQDESGRVAEFDNLFAIPVTLDVEHHEVHEGDMYSAFIYDEDAASGHTIEIHLQAPAVASPQKRIHLVIDHNATGEHLFTLSEAATYSSGGTAFTAINRNRGSGNTTDSQALRTGSNKGSNNIVTGGSPVVLESIWTGSGRGTGGESRGLQEWVLDPGEEYLIKIESKAAGIALFLQAIWYEHTDE